MSAPVVRAGSLRERVTVLRPRPAQADASGGWSRAEPEAVATVWASVEPAQAGASERDEQGRPVEGVGYTVRLRGCAALAGLRSNWLLAWRGKTLEVTGAQDTGAYGSLLALACVERPAPTVADPEPEPEPEPSP